MALTITHTTKTYPKTVPYRKIAAAILGESYGLSLVFLGEARARALNRESRGKEYVPNVLSFPLTRHAGEIYLTPAVARREARRFDHTYAEHVAYLFIHGCLHLTGLDHGARMDRLEARYCKQFTIPYERGE